MVYKLTTFTLLPGFCVLCHQPSQRKIDICQSCEDTLAFNKTACRQCALPTVQAVTSCGECLQYSSPFDRTVSAFEYKDDIRLLVRGFKYKTKLAYGRVISQLLAESIRASYHNDTMPELLLPVPLHWWRLFWRGFNQAQAICHHLSQQLNLEYNIVALKRTRATRQQNRLNRKQRLHNLKQAFSLDDNIKLPKHIALVDDVMTTGATVTRLSELLKKQGVERVDVWTIARTPKPG